MGGEPAPKAVPPNTGQKAKVQASNAVQRVKDRADEFDKRASSHRLNQNRSSATTSRVQDHHNKVNALRELRGAETISVEFYAHYCTSGTSAPQAITKTCQRKTFDAATCLDVVLDQGVQIALELFHDVPQAMRSDFPLEDSDFARGNVQFSVPKGARASPSGFSVEKYWHTRSLSDFYKHLVREGLIPAAGKPDKDGNIKPSNKDKSFRLNVCVWARARRMQEQEFDDLLESASAMVMGPPSVIPTGRMKTRARNQSTVPLRSSSQSVKRKRGQSDADTRSTARSVAQSSVAPTAAVPGAAKRRSVAREPSPEQPRYVSTFRPPSNFASQQPIEYTEFKFRKTVCNVDPTQGTADMEKLDKEEVIKIAKNWQRYNTSKEPVAGWLGGGYSKFAIRGSYGTPPQKYAILQMAPLGGIFSTMQENATTLLDELKLLCLSQYFADTFKRRASVYGVAIPDIRFNAEGAFIGEIDPDALPPPPMDLNEPSPDTRALLYTTFLATPLVDKLEGYVERKFSGSLQVGQNKDVIGRAIDAFAHHVLDDSQNTCILVDLQGFVKGDSVILFDPQAHTKDWGKTGFWDNGAAEIKNFEKVHSCNSFCRQLHLSDLKQTVEAASGRGRMAVRNLVNDYAENDTPKGNSTARLVSYKTTRNSDGKDIIEFESGSSD
ncbi:hypothetical protein C8T65DRAFT_736687 [Cerioporus squamosus]|nr:hypothetical protein C8T65DRAFT_736685 [Cerioporus squamosus]KAI0719353.1 hypothetical protein C8T65DRAFT_736687 [Cerioporus squamosus]